MATLARIAATRNLAAATLSRDNVTARLLAMTLVTACSAATPVVTQAPAIEPVVATPAVERSTPEVAATSPTATAPDPHDVPDRTAHLGVDDILLQLDYETTFGLVDIVDPFRPFGSFPAVTLYRDGTVITSDHHGTRFWRRGEQVAARDLEHVRALGAAKIRNHTSGCKKTLRGKSCVSDSARVHLRFRQRDGKLRDVVNYAGFSDTHQAQLDAIYDRLEIIGTAPWSGARPVMPWIPADASLFLRFAEDIEPVDREGLAKAAPWPLAADIFERAVREQWIVVAIDRPQILALTDRLGAHGGPASFRLDDRVVRVKLVPWLPGVDHRAAIAATKLDPRG